MEIEISIEPESGTLIPLAQVRFHTYKRREIVCLVGWCWGRRVDCRRLIVIRLLREGGHFSFDYVVEESKIGILDRRSLTSCFHFRDGIRRLLSVYGDVRSLQVDAKPWRVSG